MIVQNALHHFSLNQGNAILIAQLIIGKTLQVKNVKFVMHLAVNVQAQQTIIVQLAQILTSCIMVNAFSLVQAIIIKN